MNILEQKHLALLDEAKRRGQADTDNMRLCFEVLSLASAIDRSCTARLAPHHLSEGKFVMLFLLYNLPGGLAPHELAKRAGVTRATVTGLLDGLERDGFLSRHCDNEDRRMVSVQLTAKGQDTARDLFNEHSQWIGSLFAGFNQDERKTISSLLQRAWRNVANPLNDSETAKDNSR
ncbi:TPA: MarR family transcriptional regulator [Enterobacter asburiae]|nr:MarR family transcriptional regulator [Enterobacter asburiae]HDR2803015.1 MarR family transcriptional regulator [Enterobacter asburiae]HDR2808444.1 MarR family transcriptional regulator [Enterobacter asburiae]HDR2813881.1 MarR family transcriptional regulator [Enterobacter asburiae]